MTRPWTPGTADDDLSALAGTARLVVALDFDGTASPLVPDPMAARALPEVAVQVDRLAALPDTVVAYVSGRSMHDLRVITEHTDDSAIALAGSHGAQYWFPGRATLMLPASRRTMVLVRSCGRRRSRSSTDMKAPSSSPRPSAWACTPVVPTARPRSASSPRSMPSSRSGSRTGDGVRATGCSSSRRERRARTRRWPLSARGSTLPGSSSPATM